MRVHPPDVRLLPPPRAGEPVGRRRDAMTCDEVDVCQCHVALDHVERGVAQDPLQAEHVAAVDEVAPGEGVAQ